MSDFVVKNSYITTASRLEEIIRNGETMLFVPPFQRSYDWKRESCIRLINDLLDNAKNSDKAYYINQIVIRVIKTLPNKEYSIIDGQQRLTTIFLILSAIRSMTTEQNLKDSIEKQYLYNQINDKGGSTSRKSKITQSSDDDNDMFEYVITNQINRCDRDSKSKILKTYNDILKYFKEKNFSNIQYHSLLNEITNLTYTKIEIPDNIETKIIQKMFEKLNGTGEKLKASDLIRNYLLLPYSSTEQKNIYNKYWVPLENNVRDNIDSFFRYYLECILGKKISSDSIEVYYIFVEYFNKIISSDSISKEIIKIVNYSNIYKNILNCGFSDTLINDYLMRINKLNLLSLYPFYMEILYRYYYNGKVIDKNINTIVELLKIVENYIVRRRLSINISEKNYDEQFSSIIKFIENNFGELNPETLKYYFLDESTISNEYADDEKVREGIKEKDIYRRKGSNQFCQVVLEKLESYLGAKSIYEKFDKPQDKEGSFTIEHIMPKGSDDKKITNKKWKKYLGKNANEIFGFWVNKLANLTITAYNSELGEKEFKNKKKIYKNIDSGLFINKYFDNISNWKKNDIEKRNDELTSVLLGKVYPKLTSTYTPEKIECTFSDLVDEVINKEAIFGNSKVTVFIEDEKIINNQVIKLGDLLKEVLIFINNNYKDDINIIINENIISQISSKGDFLDSNADPIKIGERVYLNTHNGNSTKLKVLKDLLSQCEIDYESLKFEIVKKNRK